jgi:hypothetical protein
MTLNIKDRQDIAKHIVQQLGILEAEVETRCEGLTYTMLYVSTGNHPVQANFPGDGTGTLAICEDLQKNMHTQKLSAHSRIIIEIQRTQLQSQVNEVGKLLFKLFPHQPLTWAKNEDRHILKLGNATTQRISSDRNVIHTVLPRWVNPLVRLSTFLDRPITLEKKPFVFGETYGVRQSKNLLGKFSMRFISADSVTHACKQHSFKDAEDISQTRPKNVTTDMIGQLGKKEDFQSVHEEGTRVYNTIDFENITKMSNTFYEKEDGFEKLRNLVHSLISEFNFTLDMDVVQNTVTMTVEDDPVSHPDDLEVARDTRKSLHTTAVKLCDTLHHYFKEINPNLKQANIEIQSVSYNRARSWTWSYDIEGFFGRFKPNNIHNMITAVLLLKWANPSDTYTQYAFTSMDKNWTTNVNSLQDVYLVNATNLRHAWVFLFKELNTHIPENHDLFQIEYVSNTEKKTVEDTVTNDIKTSYPIS